MPLFKLIFGRQNGSTQGNVETLPECTGGDEHHGGAAPVLVEASDTRVDLSIHDGQARKIGRPTTVSRPPPRADRVKSRLVNYGQLDAVLDELEGEDDSKRRSVSRPVGWLVIIEGPGTGAWFTLQSGITLIGRGENQTVRLNYGDTAISRATHASIAYEPADHRFRLGHGRCENEVLVNGTAIQKTIELHHGDVITVGETTLRLAAFCDDRFAWAPIIDKGDRNALSA